MASARDKRLKDFRGMRDRLRQRPDILAAFLGELHVLFKDVYEAAARADDNAEGFTHALADLCKRQGIARWEDFVAPDQQRQCFKDGRDPDAQRVIAFWAELDEPLAF